MQIKVEAVKFSYQSKKVLSITEGVFESGQIYGIVGNNGVGKTTFFKTLTNIITNYQGNIQFDGENIKENPSILTKVGILLDDMEGYLLFQTPIAGSLQTGDRRVRQRLGLRHGTPLASRGVPGERGHLSSCIWNLGVFSGRCTGESLPLPVDFIHRVEFGEVSGNRVLIKRGPGNRGASQRGSTQEATSGMSS